jgi:hypothetical protein
MLFSVIPAPHQVRDKLQPESSNFNAFWMPDQVRHDDFETFYRIVNITSLSIVATAANTSVGENPAMLPNFKTTTYSGLE